MILTHGWTGHDLCLSYLTQVLWEEALVSKALALIAV